MFLLTFCILISTFAITFGAQGPTIINATYINSPNPSCNDIKFIVDYHNQCRRSLVNGTLPGQPKACNIQKMVWDEELAQLATNYSKKMIFAHNADRKSSRFSVGENLFMSAGSNKKNVVVEWKRAIDAWFNEYKLYSFQPALDDPATAHYTQVVWADTIYVGCGTTQFTDSKNWLYKYYVCNYGPTGNWYGSYPYVEDVGNELALLISTGEIPADYLNVEPVTDLLCDKNQCGMLYGPNCQA